MRWARILGLQLVKAGQLPELILHIVELNRSTQGYQILASGRASGQLIRL